MLNVTEKPLYFEEKKTHKFDYRLLLNRMQLQEQVTPKTRNRKLPCFSIFGDTSHMSTIQYLKD